MIDRIVSNLFFKEPVIHEAQIHEAIEVFHQHFGKKATRFEISRDRLNLLRQDNPRIFYEKLSGIEKRFGLEIVIDREMGDDIGRLVSEWSYDE